MTQASHPASQALCFVVAALCEVLGVHCDKHHAMVPIFRLLWGRLHRTTARFQNLFARWYEGRLRAPRKPAPRKPQAPRDPQSPRDPQAPPNPESQPRPEPDSYNPDPILPREYGWLIKLVPQAEIFGTHLQYLLADPDVATFLAEAPQAGRMLLPLCRMLGVKPLPQMLPPKRPKPATPAPDQTEERPPPRPPSAAQTASQARKRWFAENITPGPRRLIPGEDLRHVRPVSTWCRPTRPRS
jgi:hypothetical protein